LDPRENDVTSSGPWGIWATLGFSLIVVAVFVFAQLLIAAAFIAAGLNTRPESDVARYGAGLWNNGLFISVSTSTSALLCSGVVILLAWFKKRITLKQYLQLNSVAGWRLMQWLGVVIAFALLWDGLMVLLGREVIPQFMLQAYRTAAILPLFWFTLVIAAPFFEELFFRGFLFEGLRCHPRLGPIGAVLITSFLWAVVHLQYDIPEMASVFVVGIMFGVARLTTRSLYTSMAMHATINLIGTIETAVYLSSISYIV